MWYSQHIFKINFFLFWRNQFCLQTPLLKELPISTIQKEGKMYCFLDVIGSPSTYPCQWVIVSDLEIAIASPSFASLFMMASLIWSVLHGPQECLYATWKSQVSGIFRLEPKYLSSVQSRPRPIPDICDFFYTGRIFKFLVLYPKIIKN